MGLGIELSFPALRQSLEVTVEWARVLPSIFFGVLFCVSMRILKFHFQYFPRQVLKIVHIPDHHLLDGNLPGLGQNSHRRMMFAMLFRCL